MNKKRWLDVVMTTKGYFDEKNLNIRYLMDRYTLKGWYV